MGTPATYTFKGDLRKGQSDVHLVYHYDGYPSGAAKIIPDLAKVVTRIWNGHNVDFDALKLPKIEGVTRCERPDLGTTRFRYEVEMADGKVVLVKALRHEPVISKNLQDRLESAKAVLEAVEEEMRAARRVPTYIEIGKGKLPQIRKLGQND